MKRPISTTVAVSSALLLTALVACTTTPRAIGELIDPPPPPLAEGSDAGDAGSSLELMSYCPTDKCPEGFTTCPTSRFQCDVNLKADRQNCGACGSECPARVISTGETFECVEGRCVLNCDPQKGLDCDGIADNGCETSALDDANCGACGNVCTDPARPCVNDPQTGVPNCGCPGTLIACRRTIFGTTSVQCVAPEDDDNNCGACDNKCPANPDGGPLPPNSYYGCLDRKCGNFKCSPGFGDCDGDALNGCETFLSTTEYCGKCGGCDVGQECRRNVKGLLECMCPPGLTYCFGECVDLATDSRHCGTCGVVCFKQFSVSSIGICTNGVCSRQCTTGRADCNGNADDDCEVNTNSDPNNCGGCGIVCDAMPGQACVGGTCAVEPCAPDGGPLTR